MIDDNLDTEPNRLVKGIGVSVIRTIVPVVVGGLLAALAEAGLDLPEGLATEVVTTVVITLYYAVVRLLEEHVAPAWGWLLGYARPPKYDSLGPVADYDPGPYNPDAEG